METRFQMVNSIVALDSRRDDAREPSHGRNRRDWIRGEVRCLMCARMLGRLLGSRSGSRSGPRFSTAGLSFFAYRATDANKPVVAIGPDTRFRCSDCGGAGVLDDVDFFSTYDEPVSPVEDEEPVQHGPGRPPRPMRPVDPARQGLALALTRIAEQG
jgi:hypothetical protein